MLFLLGLAFDGLSGRLQILTGPLDGVAAAQTGAGQAQGRRQQQDQTGGFMFHGADLSLHLNNWPKSGSGGAIRRADPHQRFGC